MKCKYSRDMILTGYLDDELTEREQRGLAAHLENCAGCRAFAEKTRTEFGGLFENAIRSTPPDFIWENIRERITARAGDSLRPARIRVGDWLPRLRIPAFGLGAVFLILVTAAALRFSALQQQTAGIENFEDEVPYLAFMLEWEPGNEERNGYGTDIEEYFL